MHPAQTGIYCSLKGIFYISYSASSFVSSLFSRKKNIITASMGPESHPFLHPTRFHSINSSLPLFWHSFQHIPILKYHPPFSFDFIRPSLDPTLSFPPEPNFFKCAYTLGSTPSTTPKAKVTEDTGTQSTGPTALTLIP